MTLHAAVAIPGVSERATSAEANVVQKQVNRSSYETTAE